MRGRVAGLGGVGGHLDEGSISPDLAVDAGGLIGGFDQEFIGVLEQVHAGQVGGEWAAASHAGQRGRWPRYRGTGYWPRG